jgi:hypothetical protein
VHGAVGERAFAEPTCGREVGGLRENLGCAEHELGGAEQPVAERPVGGRPGLVRVIGEAPERARRGCACGVDRCACLRQIGGLAAPRVSGQPDEADAHGAVAPERRVADVARGMEVGDRRVAQVRPAAGFAAEPAPLVGERRGGRLAVARVARPLVQGQQRERDPRGPVREAAEPVSAAGRDLQPVRARAAVLPRRRSATSDLPGVRQSADYANERRAQRALPPLPKRVTAHTLRRTYISMMFAAGAEIPYVMAQVGHDDSKVTLEIYARVLKRRDRDDIGRAFDHLLLGRDEIGGEDSQATSERPQKPAPKGACAGRNSG